MLFKKLHENYLNNKDIRLEENTKCKEGCPWVVTTINSFSSFSYFSVLSKFPILSKYLFYNFFKTFKKRLNE